MMTLNCYVVDDETHALELLAGYISQTPGLKLVATESNPLIALRKLNSGEIRADITFLDIYMPDLSGIELSKLIKDKTNIIFSSAHKNYAYEAYDINVSDFLLKPVSYERFLKAVAKIFVIRNENKETINEYVFVQGDSRNRFVKISLTDIIRIEGLSNYIQVYTHSGKVHTVYTGMKLILEKLPQSLFIRVHKSHIVNLKYVEMVKGNEIIMDRSHIVPIGSKYKLDVFNLFQ